MIFHHGSFVSVYDRNGHLECHGKIVGITHSNPEFYDVAPFHEFSLASRLCGIPAARIRLANIQPELVKSGRIGEKNNAV